MSPGSKRLSRGKRLGGFLLILVIILASIAVGAAVAGWLLPPAPTDEDRPTPPMLPYAIVMVVLGVCCLVVAGCAYLVCAATHCFSFDMRRPFFDAFKKKWYVLNIVVVLPLVMAMGFLASAMTTPVLVRAGLPFPVASMGPFFVCLVVVQLVLVWVNVWAPVNRGIVRRRLAALGIASEEIAAGLLAGVSDPARSSLKKLTLVEEDVGALWFEPERLVYRGDADGFTVRPEQVVSLEQKADAGGMAAYAGAVHPILRFRDDGGSERAVRLHAWGQWTLGGLARDLDALHEKLEGWRSGGA
jgi:hypothetical protein